MSIDYYLVCDKHKEAVYFTDNHANPHEYAPIRYFLRNHILPKCSITIQTEHEIEQDNSIKRIVDYIPPLSISQLYIIVDADGDTEAERQEFDKLT